MKLGINLSYIVKDSEEQELLPLIRGAIPEETMPCFLDFARRTGEYLLSL